MPGPERQRRLDLDAELVRRHPGAIMPAMHDEAAGGDGDEIFEAGLDPVLGFDGVECDGICGGIVGGELYQLADRGFIGLLGEVHTDIPAAVSAFEGGDGGLVVIEAFVQQIDHAPRGSFVADSESRAAGSRRNE